MDITTLEHFDGVEIPVAPSRECVDILIGQSDKALLTVLEEREGKNQHKPNFVFTRRGPVASGEKSHMVQIIFLLGKFLVSVLLLNVKLAK